ncbi:hypothetical protein XENOCAPTIV_011985 [Xenoophorus captivus]|uniref:Secreted protein n=1 Tax=Xenoophorus captivus TaxID=1517983 RepID=A0ABV0QAB0_9TELE
MFFLAVVSFFGGRVKLRWSRCERGWLSWTILRSEARQRGRSSSRTRCCGIVRTLSGTRSWGVTSTAMEAALETGADLRRNGPVPGRGTASLVPQNGDSCFAACSSGVRSSQRLAGNIPTV